jgi:hypothetical protein
MTPAVVNGLDELARVVRDEIQKARIAWSNALGHAMSAGDALIAVQPKVIERGIPWKRWLKENCFVAVSTAQLYMQLAHHRDQIEAELQRDVELSLRAARKLISWTSKTENEVERASESEQEETLEAHWKRVTAAQRADFLDAIGVDSILSAMSSGFGKELRDRVPAKKPSKKSRTLQLSANAEHGMRGNGFRH